jgi:hypothetical protein
MPNTGLPSLCLRPDQPGHLFIAFRLLVALIPSGGLLLRAKHLFVAAMADDLHIVRHLDRAARLERDRRRAKMGVTAPSAARARACQ